MSLAVVRLDNIQNLGGKLLGLGCRVEVDKCSYWLTGLDLRLLR